MLSFGERLKRARERKGLTQARVMQITNISDKSLSRYETNASAPDPDTIQTLIRLYDVSPEYILGFSTEMGHAPAGTAAASANFVPDIHEKIESLSDNARKKAMDYIEMLKTLDEVKTSDGQIANFEKNA